ncbi:MAG TPA: tetratricopeptide repeat protein [Candidatus Binataceae bacterium]
MSLCPQSTLAELGGCGGHPGMYRANQLLSVRRNSVTGLRITSFGIALCFALGAATVGCQGKSAQDYIAAGDAAASNNQIDEAIGDYQKAIGLDPNLAAPHAALARLYSARAAQELARAVAINPAFGNPTSALTPAPAVAAPLPAGTPTPEPEARPAQKIKAVNKKFLLTHDSDVHSNPDGSSAVVANVHRRKYVHVIGIAGDWLQVKLKTGVVGFIPISAAE